MNVTTQGHLNPRQRDYKHKMVGCFSLHYFLVGWVGLGLYNVSGFQYFLIVLHVFLPNKFGILQTFRSAARKTR